MSLWLRFAKQAFLRPGPSFPGLWSWASSRGQVEILLGSMDAVPGIIVPGGIVILSLPLPPFFRDFFPLEVGHFGFYISNSYNPM